MINCLLLIPLWTVAAIVHELGHAAVNKQLGFKVYQVSIGSGRPLLTMKLFGFPFEFHRNLLWGGGLTLSAGPQEQGLRLRQWLCTAAGPAANLLLAGLIYATHGGRAVWHVDWGRPMPLGMLFIANAFAGVGSVFPYNYRSRPPSDGYRLVTIPFLNAQGLAAYRAAYFELEGVFVRSGHAREAIGFFERARQINPDSTAALLGLHSNYMQLGDYVAAREPLVRLVAGSHLKDRKLRNLILNDLAWTNLQLDDPSLLPEADAYSREAFGGDGANTFYRGTRGAVLVGLGDYDGGIGLLTQAYGLHTTSAARGAVAYWAAIGEARRGNQNGAEGWLKKAVDNCPDDPLRRRAEAEILKATLTI